MEEKQSASKEEEFSLEHSERAREMQASLKHLISHDPFAGAQRHCDKALDLNEFSFLMHCCLERFLQLGLDLFLVHDLIDNFSQKLAIEFLFPLAKWLLLFL